MAGRKRTITQHFGLGYNQANNKNDSKTINDAADMNSANYNHLPEELKHVPKSITELENGVKFKYLQWNSSEPKQFNYRGLNIWLKCIHVHESWKPIHSSSKYSTVDNNTTNTITTLLKQVNKLKALFDHVKDHRLFALCRDLCNPFEEVRRGHYINRSAVKLAELDNILDGKLSDKIQSDDTQVLDVCAAPGGWTEYFIRKYMVESTGVYSINKKVIAITIRGLPKSIMMHHDLNKFNGRYFKMEYGHTMDYSHDGDITDPATLDTLTRFNLEPNQFQTVVADGGVDVEGSEEHQELLNLSLLIGSCLLAITKLKVGGTFTVKTYDHCLVATNYILYLTSLFFKRTKIIKPGQSRPANSERYVAFEDKMNESDDDDDGIAQIQRLAVQWMFKLHKQLQDNKGTIHSLSRAANNISPIDISKFDLQIQKRVIVNATNFFQVAKYAQLESLELQLQYLTAIHETLALLNVVKPHVITSTAWKKSGYQMATSHFTSIFDGVSSTTLCDQLVDRISS